MNLRIKVRGSSPEPVVELFLVDESECICLKACREGVGHHWIILSINKESKRALRHGGIPARLGFPLDDKGRVELLGK